MRSRPWAEAISEIDTSTGIITVAITAAKTLKSSIFFILPSPSFNVFLLATLGLNNYTKCIGQPKIATANSVATRQKLGTVRMH